MIPNIHIKRVGKIKETEESVIVKASKNIKESVNFLKRIILT